MKEIKVLKFEELSTEQKLGMALCSYIGELSTEEKTEENIEYILDLIKNHSLGTVFVNATFKGRDAAIARIKEVADYPVLICCDAERGFPAEGYEKIGAHNAIGTCNTTDSAYAFGFVTAVNARKAGYNVVFNPVLDMTDENCTCGCTIRSIGGDKVRVTELAAAEAQGMHDGGVLTVGKHYPSVKGNPRIDSHMAENSSDISKEDLIDYYLYPYLELNKKGLLDGIMTGHYRLTSIDPDFPTSLSKKNISVIRDLGFEGFTVTDALSMASVVSKFGWVPCRGMAIAGGNSLALVWGSGKAGYTSMLQCYKDGLIPDDMLDSAVSYVLAAQHKVTLLDTTAEITEEEKINYDKINTDGVYAKVDEGYEVALPKDKKHYFVILCDNESDVNNGEISVATMQDSWYNPQRIAERLKELYPDSRYRIVKEYPAQRDIQRIVEDNLCCDDVVFVTFIDTKAYIGVENFAPRVYSLVEALQITNRVSTILHFGNPFVLEEFVHVPRIIIGGVSPVAVEAGLNVLSGEYPAKGNLTYDVKFK